MNLNIFSKSTKHAIQAMIYLASNKDKPVLVVTIADYYSIPVFYLSKIIQTLRKHNLVSSIRGRGGGISLKRKPKTIHVSDIVNAIEGKDDEKQMCAYGIDICSDFVPCPIRSLRPSTTKTVLYFQFSTMIPATDFNSLRVLRLSCLFPLPPLGSNLASRNCSTAA